MPFQLRILFKNITNLHDRTTPSRGRMSLRKKAKRSFFQSAEYCMEFGIVIGNTKFLSTSRSTCSRFSIMHLGSSSDVRTQWNTLYKPSLTGILNIYLAMCSTCWGVTPRRSHCTPTKLVHEHSVGCYANSVLYLPGTIIILQRVFVDYILSNVVGSISQYIVSLEYTRMLEPYLNQSERIYEEGGFNRFTNARLIW